MLLVQVKNVEGQVTRQVAASGEQLTLSQGEQIHCHVEASSLSSLVREGGALKFYLNNVILIEVLNFFEGENQGLVFDDQQFTVQDIASKLTLNLSVTQGNQAARCLEAEPGSRMRVYDGDKFEFNNAEVTPNDLHRRGNDLRVVFHLEGDDENENDHFDLIDFFAKRPDQVVAPTVLLADSDHKTTDKFVQPNQQSFQMIASPSTMATAGMLYAFYFVIKNYDQAHSNVDVLIDGKVLPEWLSLNHLGHGKFSLTGIPPAGFEGTTNVEIKVSTKEDDVNVHTQESYKLVVTARPEMTERAAVGGVMVAETRGAVATHTSEGFMASSQSSASASAPLAIVAALSSLSVFGIVKAVRLEGGEFSSSSAMDFLAEEISIEFGGLNLGATVLLGGSNSSGFSDFASGADGLQDGRRFESKEREERDNRDEESSEFAGNVELSFDEQISSYDAAAANFAGTFGAFPDTVMAFENETLVVRRPGLIENDLNEQTPFELIIRVFGDEENVSKRSDLNVIELPSVVDGLPPALLTVFRRGEMIYEPNGAWEFLAEGEVNSEHTFDYTLGNLLSESGTLVTIEVTGQNDDPFLFDQTFNINENALIDTLVNEQFILGDDVDYLDTALLELVETRGDTNGFNVSLTGNFVLTGPRGDGEINFALSVEDSSVLNYEQMPTFQFDVELTDPYGATDTATITVNLLNVNEAPIVLDQNYVINESTPNSTPINTRVGRFNADDEDLVDGDILHFFNNTPLEDAITIQDLTNNRGDIRVNDPTQFNYELFNGVAPEISFQVRVEDEGPLDDQGGRIGSSLSSFATVTITVLNVNETPTVAINQVYNILEQTPDNLYAPNFIVGQLVADDPDLAIASEGEFLTFTDLDGVNEFNITNNGLPNMADLVIQNANLLDFETNSQVVFNLEVEDAGLFVDVGNATVANGTVTVNILNVNEAPVLNPGNFVVEVYEDMLPGLISSFGATDPDALVNITGESLSYSAVGLNPLFSLITQGSQGAETAELLLGGMLDFETQPQQYQFQLTVQDAGIDGPQLSDTQTVTINVLNANEAPVLDAANVYTIDVAENAMPGDLLSFLANDPDFAMAPEVLSFSIDDGLNGLFELNNSGAPGSEVGTLSLVGALDFESESSHTLTLTVEDSGTIGLGNVLTDTATLVINVLDVNDAPVMNNQAVSVSENAQNGVVSSVVATDQDEPADMLTFTHVSGATGIFTVLANGDIELLDDTVLDHEMQSSYTLNVDVSDGILTDTAVVTVNLQDVVPVIADNQVIEGVLENTSTSTDTPNGTVIGNINDMVEVDTDVDQSTLSFSESTSTVSSVFDVLANGDIIVQDESALDFETNPTFDLHVDVNDGSDTGSTVVTINLADVNDAPTIDDQSINNVSENVTNGTVVGQIVANDVDTDSSDLTFTELSGNDVYTVNSDGSIEVADDSTLDFEGPSNGRQTLEVEVTDNSGPVPLTAVAFVTINLSNVEPVIANQSFTVIENTSNNTIIGQIAMDVFDTDPGQLDLTFSEVGSSNRAFRIDSDGVIRVQNQNRVDDRDSSETLNVRVTDGSDTDTATITMNIVQAQNNMIATQGEVAPSAGTPDLTLTDAEGLMAAAEHYWDQIINVNFEGVSISVQDLPGDLLGVTSGNNILLDINGAGHGWFIDSTPFDNAEFDIAINKHTYTSDMGEIDLLTVLMHELGHVIGLDEHHEDGLFMADLDNGVRLLPDHDIINDDVDLNFAVLDLDENSSNTLAEISADDVLLDTDDLDFSSTQTTYADDLPSQANSVNDHSYDGGSGYNDGFDSLVVNDQESVV